MYLVCLFLNERHVLRTLYRVSLLQRIRKVFIINCMEEMHFVRRTE